MIDEKKEIAYCRILEEELLEATGCTEPIALAYCAAKMREVLDENPTEVTVQVSGNILKNVKSVVVPNTGGKRGVAAAAAVGIVAGDASAQLQVLAKVSEEDVPKIQEFMDAVPMKVECLDTPYMLDILVIGKTKKHTAKVRITNNHTNVVYIAKDEQVLLELPLKEDAEDNLQDKSVLNVADILDFVQNIELEKIQPLISKQIAYNVAISKEGISGHYGANIGKNLMVTGNGAGVIARAWAAAGSDARMNGCEMPVIILSGSGNQGITASVPVWSFGTMIGASEEKIIRAVCLSDLLTVHQKTGIGRLSAYCGAVSAGVGAGCGIAWLRGADYEGVCHTLQNAVAMISGTICDGAKASCASKITMAVETGILGYDMFLNGDNFESGDGIVGKDVEETIANVGILASQGMKEEDRVILDIMTR